MKVDIREFSVAGAAAAVFNFSPSPEDPEVIAQTERSPKRMVQHQCFCRLLPSASLQDTHPDLLALAALLLAGRFAASRMELPFAVSRGFAEAVQRHLELEIPDVAPTLLGRETRSDFRPGLAYSGGVDSTSALLLLPENSVAVFAKRMGTPSTQRQTKYRPDAALHACASLRKQGREVYALETDFEALCEPLGVSVDWAFGLPIVLHADALAVDSLAMGLVLEPGFCLGKGGFSELSERYMWRDWAPVFEAASLPLLMPTLGVSKVATEKLVLQELSHIGATSCVRGMANSPCKECSQCFREQLLMARHTGIQVDASLFQRAIEIKPLAAYLCRLPLNSESALAYALYNLDGASNPVAALFQERAAIFRSHFGPLETLEKLYTPALDYLPARYRAPLQHALEQRVAKMTETEIQQIRSWDAEPLLSDPDFLGLLEKLRSFASKGAWCTDQTALETFVSQAGEGPRVVLLVLNPCSHDYRVLKEAQALQAMGCAAMVVAKADKALLPMEMVSGVPVIRVALEYGQLQPPDEAGYYASIERIKQRWYRRIDRVRHSIHAINGRPWKKLRSRRKHELRKRYIRYVLLAPRKTLLRLLRTMYRRHVLLRKRVYRMQRRVYKVHRRMLRAWYKNVQAYKVHYNSTRQVLHQINPEAIHANDLNTLYAAWRLGRELQCPHVYDSHEFESGRNFWGRRLSVFHRMVRNWVECRGARSAAGVFTVSEPIARALQQRYNIPLPTILYNSHFLQQREEYTPGLRELAGLGEQAQIVVYTGVIIYGRGIEQLLQALPMLPETCHLVCLGPQRQDTHSLIWGLAGDLGVEGRVHLLPPVRPEQVPATIRDADVLAMLVQNVCLSYQLTLPNKLFDVVWSGVPVLSCGFGDMARFVKEHELGLCCDETDAQDIAKGLLHLLQSPKPPGLEPARLARLQEAYCWERQAEKLTSVYRNILSTRGIIQASGSQQG